MSNDAILYRCGHVFTYRCLLGKTRIELKTADIACPDCQREYEEKQKEIQAVLDGVNEFFGGVNENNSTD